MSGAAVAEGAGDMRVFSAAQHQLGRRLYLPAASRGGPLQSVTGGVIIFAGKKTYQITAWNPSFRRDKLPPKSAPEAEATEAEEEVEAEAEAGAIVTTNWDLEGSDSSDLENDDESEGGGPERGRDTLRPHHPSSIEMTAVSSSTSNPHHISQAATSSASAPALGEQVPRPDVKGRSLDIPRGCTPIGELAAASGPWTEQRDRCVLVELLDVDANEIEDANTIPYASRGGGLRVRVTKLRNPRISNVTPGEPDEPSLAAIAAVAGHSARCQLLTTPVLLTLKGQSRCCDVFQVNFVSHLFQDEDYGAAVLGPKTGEVFGQVVFGYPGAQLAYILPMEDIFQDVTARIGRSDITFYPPGEVPRLESRILHTIKYGSWKPATHWARAAKTEAHDVVELASPKYYKCLSGDKMPRRQRLRSIRGRIQGSLAVIKQFQPQLPRSHGKAGHPVSGTARANFFSLPPEIRDIIINQLSFRCAMNFRQVSKACRAAVSINGPAISKRLLDKCPLPPLARRLYPNSLPDLKYVWDVGYRHTVASKLAGHMASWLEREMYLYRSRYQRQVFEDKRNLIHKRLLPALFTAFHFFELYPQSLASVLDRARGLPLRSAARRRKPFPITYELRAMECYSNDVLLHTHDVMKCLVPFFRSVVSPASYYGPTERLLRRCYQGPPDDMVLATILCLGGLDKVLQLADIEDYSKRIGEVDKMYATLTTPREGSSLHGESAMSREESPRGTSGGSEDEEQWHLWQNLPHLEQIWRYTAEELVVRRGIVQGPQELRNLFQVLTELVKPASAATAADQLYEEHQLWHGLSNHTFDTVDG